MTTMLEQRYRTVLRLLPSYYRAAREEEMVEAYLHGFDERQRDELRPAWGEVASIAALAVRTRMGAAGAPARYATLGAVVRLFALLSVLLQAASGVTGQALLLAWVHGAAPRDRDMVLEGFTGHGAAAGLYEVVRWLIPPAWTVAYLALLRDHRRTALAFAALAALPGLAFVTQHLDSGQDALAVSFSLTATVFSWLTVVALCCAFHRDAPPARLPLASPGLALMGTCVLMGASTVVWQGGADPGWAGGVAFVAAAAVWLVARCRSPQPAGDPALPVALAALGLAMLVERTLSLAFLADAHAPGFLLTVTAVQAGVIAALAAALTAIGSRGLTAARCGTG
ncbi:hypothetical protein SAMN06272775_4585 [Streptomyces sp. 2323.1]|uniref:hypothetical protein n=1 Tax=Streptomyces sp. 2323.1 TaxID=1938841 RepID=UPI000BB6B18D|nr:hypothetical protein [Streptomyces sp. 2323.1]SOE13606.1 hypothetical protein SAMN06272775_4585 [Streptomyces sp. 2323.1]